MRFKELFDSKFQFTHLKIKMKAKKLLPLFTPLFILIPYSALVTLQKLSI